LSDKMVKAFTAPKSEEILLSDAGWIQDPKHDHIWICVKGHSLLRDNVFYQIVESGSQELQFFCNLTTWTNYNSFNYGHSIDQTMAPLFFSLYKVLTKDYYET